MSFRLKEVNSVHYCCFKIWNLCGDLRSVTHDFDLGGAVLADRTVVGGGSRHQLYLVALIDVILGEAPPTDEEACLSTQTALCWSDGVYLGLWNPTHKNQFDFNWLCTCDKQTNTFIVIAEWVLSLFKRNTM